MLVRIQEYKYGGYIFKPVNRTIVKQFHKDMIDNGATAVDCSFDQLLQLEDIVDYIPANKLKDLKDSWLICINIDNWIVRQFFGYCSN